MAIASRTASYGNTTSATYAAVEPSGAAENDVLFYWVQYSKQNQTFISGPSGWTLLNTWNADADQDARLYWRRRGSDALSAAERTFTTNQGSWIEVEMLAFSGCLTTGDPWDAAQYATQADAAAPNPPSATSAGAGRYAVAFGMTWSSAGTGGASAPTNYTLTRTGNDADGAFSAYRSVGSGAEDPAAFGNISGTDACSAATIILTPAGGAPASITKQAAAYYRMMRNR